MTRFPLQSLSAISVARRQMSSARLQSPDIDATFLKRKIQVLVAREPSDKLILSVYSPTNLSPGNQLNGIVLENVRSGQSCLHNLL